MLPLLPPSILDRITRLLPGQYIGLIWICGDKSLNAKLGTQGGVRQFSIATRTPFRHGWPLLLAQFRHLSFLGIGNDLNMPFSTSLFYDFSIVSRTTSHIDIDMDLASSTFIRFLKVNPSYFSAITNLRLLNHTEMFDEILAQLPPSLANLERLDARFKVLQLGLLPPSLTDLGAECYFLEGDKFPEQLTALSFISISSEVSLAALPRGLCSLRLSRKGSLTPSEFADLPRTLTSINVQPSSDDATAIKNLPESLTHLNLRYSLPAAHSPLLPRCLKSVALSGKLTKPLIDSLPPTLTRIDASHAIMDYIHLYSLPATIRELNLSGNIGDKTFEALDLKLLPSLQRLHVDFLPTILAQSLPHSLTELTVGQSHLLQEVLPLLPPYLTLFSVGGLLLEGSERSLCSPAFKPLYKPSMLANDDSYSALAVLPSSLTELRVRTPQKKTVKDFIFCTLSAASATPEASFSRFKELQKLTLEYISITDVSMFANLAPTLTELTLSAVEHLELDCLSGLPKSLAQFSLKLVTYLPGIGHNILIALPRSLAYFSYHIIGKDRVDHDITDESLASLPTSLNRLIIPSAPAVTEAVKDRLPKDLTQLLIGHSRPSWSW